MEPFTYEGDVYVRAIGRGVVLENSKTDLLFEIERFVDAPLSHGWEGRLRIVIEKLDDETST